MAAALAAYRNILRATQVAFQGDLPVLHAARLQARNAFQANKSSDPTDPETQKQIYHAQEVAQILRRNVVQAKKTEVKGDERWRLRIHEETERGDNESIKMAGEKNTATSATSVSCESRA